MCQGKILDGEITLKVEKNIRICDLLDMYGVCLNKKQYELLTEHFANDISLSEIAENQKVSKQAVQDLISRATKKLEWYESKLNFLLVKQLVLKIEQGKDNTEVIAQINNLLN